VTPPISVAPLWRFIGGAYAVTWSLVLGARLLGGEAGHPLHLVGLLGPLIAVVFALRSRAPAPYRAAFWRRVLDVRRVPLRWWGAIVVVGLAPALVGRAAAALIGSVPRSDEAITLGVAVGAIAFAVGAGLVEEPGWRGVAIDGAAPAAGWVRATLVLGVLWSGWHLPLYVLSGTYQHDLGFGGAEFWVSMAARVPLAVLLVWLCHRTGGAIVAAVIAHALGNAIGEVLPGSLATMAAELSVLTAAAVAVIAVVATSDRPPPGATTRP
jgi:uncharacterized protein